jgi:hypothetical protein
MARSGPRESANGYIIGLLEQLGQDNGDRGAVDCLGLLRTATVGENAYSQRARRPHVAANRTSRRGLLAVAEATDAVAELGAFPRRSLAGGAPDTGGSRHRGDKVRVSLAEEIASPEDHSIEVLELNGLLEGLEKIGPKLSASSNFISWVVCRSRKLRT